MSNILEIEREWFEWANIFLIVFAIFVLSFMSIALIFIFLKGGIS